MWGALEPVGVIWGGALEYGEAVASLRAALAFLRPQRLSQASGAVSAMPCEKEEWLYCAELTQV